MTSISIRPAVPDDAKLLTDLSYTTFWDAFAHHPKNAPDDSLIICVRHLE